MRSPLPLDCYLVHCCASACAAWHSGALNDVKVVLAEQMRGSGAHARFRSSGSRIQQTRSARERRARRDDSE
jgi:hypothetical protein